MNMFICEIEKLKIQTMHTMPYTYTHTSTFICNENGNQAGTE